MKSKHITEILDRSTFGELSQQEQAVIALHTEDCFPCRKAFEAARLSAVLLKANSTSAAAAPVPTPFFQAKVMNAWHERQQTVRRPIAAFRRWWQASAAPIFLMLVTVAVLISLTVFAPQSSADDSVEVSSFNLYSTESVILNQKPSRDLTTEQVFQVVYTSRSETRK